jgi:4-hydroxy-tetrahydrodipicolinate reductase
MEKISVGVIGAFGRLGQLIVSRLESLDNIVIGGVLQPRTPNTSPHQVFSTVMDVFKNTDIVIDVSRTSLFDEILDAANRTKKPFVSGTTGLSAVQLQNLEKLSSHIPILYATNFSTGIAILNRLLAHAAAQLGPTFDAEIVEFHHRHKVDAPSGTAMTMGKIIANARDQDFETMACFDRTQRNEIRPHGEIGFAVARGGAVFGEHAVHFISEEEQITLSHTAFNRDVFAKGAVQAILWLYGKEKGFYNMQDIFK